MTNSPKGRITAASSSGKCCATYTRETVTLASGAGKLAPGTVLGKITTGGKYTGLAPAASNGSQNAAGILWECADATDADAPGCALIRGPAIVTAMRSSGPRVQPRPRSLPPLRHWPLLASSCADRAQLPVPVKYKEAPYGHHGHL